MYILEIHTYQFTQLEKKTQPQVLALFHDQLKFWAMSFTLLSSLTLYHGKTEFQDLLNLFNFMQDKYQISKDFLMLWNKLIVLEIIMCHQQACGKLFPTLFL